MASTAQRLPLLHSTPTCFSAAAIVSTGDGAHNEDAPEDALTRNSQRKVADDCESVRQLVQKSYRPADETRSLDLATCGTVTSANRFMIML